MQYNAPYGSTTPNANFLDGNPSIGLNGSIIPAAAVGNTQWEIVNAISGAGLTPTNANLFQLWMAMQLSPWIQESANDTGSVNAYSAAIPNPPPQLYPGMSVRIKIANTNTLASTLSLNAFGTYQIVRANGQSLQANDLTAGQIAWLIYDGAHFQIANYGGSGGGGGGGTVTTIGIPYAVDTGTVNNLVGSFSPAVTSLVAGTAVLIQAEHANTGAMSLTANATPTESLTWSDGTTIQGGLVQPGMILLCCYDGVKWQLLSRMTAGGVASSGQAAGNAGQLNLVAGNLVFAPKNGNTIVINGALQTIPAGGIVLAPTGLQANTLYYIYVTMSSGVMTLVASTTAYTTSTLSGMQIMTGNEPYTLVGAAYTIPGPAFVDASNQRYVLSWFNKRTKKSQTSITSTVGTGSQAWIEISQNLRNNFICWAGDYVEFISSGAAYATGGQLWGLAVNFNSASYSTIEPEQACGGTGSVGNNGYGPCAITGRKVGLSEGQNWATLMGVVFSGAGASYYGGQTAGGQLMPLALTINIQG